MTTKTVSGIPVWPSRDPIQERGGMSLYRFINNNGIGETDFLGLIIVDLHVPPEAIEHAQEAAKKNVKFARSCDDVKLPDISGGGLGRIIGLLGENDCSVKVNCICDSNRPGDGRERGRVFGGSDVWVYYNKKGEDLNAQTLMEELSHSLDRCTWLPRNPDCDQLACTEVKAKYRAAISYSIHLPNPAIYGAANAAKRLEDTIVESAGKSAAKKCGSEKEGRAAARRAYKKCALGS